MAYCPRCRSEYRAGVTHCPDCDEALLSGAPPEEGPLLHDDPAHEPVVLCRIADSTEAQLICAALQEEGIRVASQACGPIASRLALVTDGQAPDDYTTIRVPQGQLAKAQQVLAALRSATFVWPAGLEPEEPAP